MEERELPVGWAMSKLEELITNDGNFSDGDWVESKDQDPDGEIRLLQLADIGDACFLNKSRRFVNEQQYERLRCTEVLEGDILIARMPDPLGRACLVPPLGQLLITVVDIAIVRPGQDSVLPQWLMHFINAPQSRSSIELQSTGTTRRRITRKKLAVLEFPLPPLNEQRRIAAKLDTTLAAVEACRQRLDGVAAILKRFRQDVLAAATSGELTRGWREERGMEKDWLETCLSDIAEIQGGLTKDSKKQDSGDPELPYLRVANVQRGYLDLREIAFIRVPRKRFDALLLQHGDIFFNEGGDREKVGRGWIWEGQLAECVFQNHVFRARLLNQGNQPKYVSWWANTCGASHFLGQGKQTTNLASISKTTLGLLPIQLPCAAEQEEIVRRVETFFTLADQLEARLNAAHKIVDRLTPALLAKAFRGELVPQDPNDEPASVLLERIRAARQAEAGTGKPSRRGRPKAAANPDQLPLDAAPVPLDFLAGLLRECGALSERALLAVSELEPERFEQQLFRELERGTAREVQADGQVLLEAVG
jgi:type I restriction enzyme S subunit